MIIDWIVRLFLYMYMYMSVVFFLLRAYTPNWLFFASCVWCAALLWRKVFYVFEWITAAYVVFCYLLIKFVYMCCLIWGCVAFFVVCHWCGTVVYGLVFIWFDELYLRLIYKVWGLGVLAWYNCSKELMSLTIE